jgi:hypothetical protein
VALTPQRSVPQFFEPPLQPDPLRGLWTSVVAGALLVLGLIGELFTQIAARWRGIVLLHLFFLTLWLAVQVFFFATGAYWCLPSDSSKFAGWFSKFFPQISSCGPAISVRGSLQSPGSLPVSPVGSPMAASPGSRAASSSPGSASSPASPTPPSAAAPPAASSPASPPPSSPAPPPPSSRGSPAAASPGSATVFNGSVANCWRDRSLGSKCFAGAGSRRRLPPARFRRPAYPCRRASECGWDDI